MPLYPEFPRVVKVLLGIDFNVPTWRIDMGHRHAMLQHFLDGIQWALRDLDGPSKSLPLPQK